MSRGRKPINLPVEYIYTLYKQGYSCEFICWKLHHEFGISVSRWTMWRRLRDMGVNFATNGRGICRVKAGVDAMNSVTFYQQKPENSREECKC